MNLQKPNNSLRAQIVSAIQNDIFNHREVGEKLPSESEYADEFGVTRSTVQKALKDLQQMSLIEKVQGKGSFVRQKRPKVKLFNFKGLSDYALQIGATPINKLLTHKIVEEQGTHTLLLRRLRIFKTDSSTVPMTVDESRLNLSRFKGLDKYDFAKQSLYSVIRKEYKVITEKTMLRMVAISADDELAEAFKCKVNDPLLQTQGIVRDEQGEVVEKVRVTYSDFAEFDLTLGI